MTVAILAALCRAIAAKANDVARILLSVCAEKAKAADPAFSGFSAERGHSFYPSEHPLRGIGMVSCASCHRKDPREQIVPHRVDILCRACHVINDEEHPEPKRAKSRYIEPFAPHANPQRLSDAGHAKESSSSTAPWCSSANARRKRKATSSPGC
jgi:hypothetical protein